MSLIEKTAITGNEKIQTAYDTGTNTNSILPASLVVTQLELITEGGNTGWRLRGRDPLDFGDIGVGALDFSSSIGPSSTRGALGDGSVAFGSNAYCSGAKSMAWGTPQRCHMGRIVSLCQAPGHP